MNYFRKAVYFVDSPLTKFNLTKKKNYNSISKISFLIGPEKTKLIYPTAPVGAVTIYGDQYMPSW